MSLVRFAAFVGGLLVVLPLHAQTVLTFRETLARARERAGALAVARARVAEAEAELLGASARLRDNPVFEAAAGPRSSADTRTTDLDIAISQQFETGGQRGARISAGLAAVEGQKAAVEQTTRNVVLDAALAFMEGIAAEERLEIAEQADQVSRELHAATERRYAAGDIAAIDLNLARVDAARSAASRRAALLDLTTAVGNLRSLLRVPSSESIELEGSLDLGPAPSLQVLETSVDQRPDFAVLAAETREAEAQVRLGQALTRPDLGFRLGYEREETDSIFLGGLTITLPLFQRGRGTLAAGSARASRVRLELELAREKALVDLRTAYTIYEQRAELAAVLVGEAAPSLDDNETLSRRSYEAGEMNLMELLLIRRGALETRTSIIDRRLDAARSRLAVEFLAGVLR